MMQINSLDNTNGMIFLQRDPVFHETKHIVEEILLNAAHNHKKTHNTCRSVLIYLKPNFREKAALDKLLTHIDKSVVLKQSLYLKLELRHKEDFEYEIPCLVFLHFDLTNESPCM